VADLSKRVTYSHGRPLARVYMLPRRHVVPRFMCCVAVCCVAVCCRALQCVAELCAASASCREVKAAHHHVGQHEVKAAHKHHVGQHDVKAAHKHHVGQHDVEAAHKHSQKSAGDFIFKKESQELSNISQEFIYKFCVYLYINYIKPTSRLPRAKGR